MKQIVILEKHLEETRKRLSGAMGQNEEFLAMYDGLTACLSAIAAELAMLREDMKRRDDA